MLNDIYWAIDPVAFTIGPATVRWYGLAYAVGFLCAGLIMYFTAKRWEIKLRFETLLTVVLCAMVGIIVGARLGYCLFYGDGYYFEYPLEILNLPDGGMSFHGGAIGGIIGGIVAAKVTGIPFLTLTDLAVIGAPIGLFFGRCANFINGELWGAPTDLPWGVIFETETMLPRHPSQLYEALLEGVLLFIILFALSRKKPPFSRGTFTGLFMVLYSIFRFAIEFVRIPDAQIGYLFGGWLTMGMVLSLPLFLAGVCIIIFARSEKLPQEGEGAERKRDWSDIITDKIMGADDGDDDDIDDECLGERSDEKVGEESTTVEDDSTKEEGEDITEPDDGSEEDNGEKHE